MARKLEVVVAVPADVVAVAPDPPTKPVQPLAFRCGGLFRICDLDIDSVSQTQIDLDFEILTERREPHPCGINVALRACLAVQ